MYEIYSWFKENYFNQIEINLLDGSKEYKNRIRDTTNFPLKRMMAFIQLKYSLTMKTSGYTYVTFRLDNKRDKKIFAVAYYLKDIPKFICLSPTFDSAKGEFRDGFILYEAFINTFKKCGKELNDIEESIRNNLSNGKIIIDYEFYPKRKALDEDLTLLSLQLLVGSIYLILYKKQQDQLQVHTDKMYIQMLKEIYDDKPIGDMSKHIYNNFFKGGMDRPYGQKLIPMNVGEAIKINNIQYATWRELFISYAASDMVINSISPTFAIAANWSYIEGANQDMFDNEIIKDRYVQNKDIVNMISSMKQLYKESESIDNINESRERIYNTICQLNLNKLLSDVAIVRIDEFADVTVGTLARTIKTAKILPPKCKKFISDIKFFDKIIFDLMYGCHVLHKRVGAIHLDLHLNNMTIMEVDSTFYERTEKEYKYVKNKKYNTAFILNGQCETYMFPFDGYYGTIIDFSDSVVSRKFLEFTCKYVTFDSFENIIDREKEYILSKLSTYSYVKKHKDKVKGAIISKYEDMFKAISAIDFVSITKNIRCMFETSLKDEVSDNIMKRICQLEDESLEYLLSSVQNVVDNEGKDIEYVGDVLLKKFFSNYLYHKSCLETDIYEVYNFNAKWNYSGVEYESYPPWAKRDLLIKKFGKSSVDKVFGDTALPPEIDRDVHLAFLVEKMSFEYGLNIIQTSTGSSHDCTFEEFIEE